MLIEIAQGTVWEFSLSANNFLAHLGAPLWDSSNIFLKSLPLRNLNQISEPRCSRMAFYSSFPGGTAAAFPNFRDLVSSQHEDKLQIVTAAYQYLFYIQDFCFPSRKVHLKSWTQLEQPSWVGHIERFRHMEFN